MADDNENTKVYSNENLEILSDSDERDFYSEDQINDYAKDNAGVTYQDTVDAQDNEDVEINITQSDLEENTKSLTTEGVQKFEGYYGFTKSDFKDEFSKAARNAIVQTYITGFVPRLTSDLVDAVARDQTKHLVGQFLKKAPPAPDYKINIGLRFKKPEESSFSDDFAWYKGVQDFGGMDIQIVNAATTEDGDRKEDASTIKNSYTTVKFGLLNLKDMVTGSGQTWEDFNKFISLYNYISTEQARKNPIDVEAVVEFEAADSTLLKIFSTESRYNYRFKLEKVHIKDIGFNRLSRFTNKHAAVARFSIVGIPTKVDAEKKDGLKGLKDNVTSKVSYNM